VLRQEGDGRLQALQRAQEVAQVALGAGEDARLDLRAPPR